MAQSATPQATKEKSYQNEYIVYNPLGKTGLWVSQIGFGGYRINSVVDSHYEALKQALLQGVNLIESDPNYSDGGSEELIGNVLNELLETEKAKREDIVVITQGGYLKGKQWAESQKRKKEGIPFKELVEFSTGFEYCIHPEFLEWQLNSSLERLKLDTIDGYLIRNPEHYLAWAEKNNIPQQEAQEEYYKRIKNAFELLESQVAAGKISFYGVSSNAFVNAHDDYEFTDLEKLIDIAKSISPNHSFQFIQLPVNLLEPEGITQKTKAGKTTMQIAKENGLAYFVNRPLNAVYGNKRIRLTDYTIDEKVSSSFIQKLIEELLKEENEFRAKYAQAVNAKTETDDLFTTGQLLSDHWKDFQDYIHWKELLTLFFIPKIEKGIESIVETGALNDEMKLWTESYLKQLNRVINAINNYFKAKAGTKSKAVKEIVKKIDSDWSSAKTLSQMAIRALRSTEGITAVLVGMKESHYVQDIFNELEQPIVIQNREASWQTLARNL
jgi:aryl-alcohol dehydrogenase-like predicted oxidoreductase